MTDKEAIHMLKSYAGMTHKLTDNQGRPKLDQAIEIVLNLIQTQQKEIEILKQEKATAWEEWNIINEYCEQEKQKHKAEIEKKDKIIDEMAEYMEQEMDEYQLDNIYAELHNCNGMERNWTRGKEAEIKDIKEYFINKVEKENKDE